MTPADRAPLRRRRAALLAPVVVGLVAGGGLLAWRADDQPPAWCRRASSLTTLVDAGIAGPGGVDDLPRRVAAALGDLDPEALIDELPADLAADLRPHRAELLALLAAVQARPGTVPTPDQLDPALLRALTDLVDRFVADCQHLA